MITDKRNRYREMLLALRERARGEVNHVVQALQEEVNVNENTSNAPVHLADVAAEAVDAHVQVLQTERTILDEINAALAPSTKEHSPNAPSVAAQFPTNDSRPFPTFPPASSVPAPKRIAVISHKTTIMRLSGFDAIEYAEKEGLTLNKSADNIDDGASGLSIAEAEAIADERPELIWVEVPADEYYGEPRNMEPGTEPSRGPTLAGQRPDELLPGQNSGRGSRDIPAAGTAGGGLAAGGLAGTNAPHGLPESGMEEAFAFGPADTAGDERHRDEPQSGRHGGAVGGTPAGKRARPE